MAFYTVNIANIQSVSQKELSTRSRSLTTYYIR